MPQKQRAFGNRESSGTLLPEVAPPRQPVHNNMSALSLLLAVLHAVGALHTPDDAVTDVALVRRELQWTVALGSWYAPSDDTRANGTGANGTEVIEIGTVSENANLTTWLTAHAEPLWSDAQPVMMQYVGQSSMQHLPISHNRTLPNMTKIDRFHNREPEFFQFMWDNFKEAIILLFMVLAISGVICNGKKENDSAWLTELSQVYVQVGQLQRFSHTPTPRFPRRHRTERGPPGSCVLFAAGYQVPQPAHAKGARRR
jgi:hypothetical protein